MGTWSTAATWQMYDGTNWNTAASAPTGTSGTITIQSGHTINITTPLEINIFSVVINGYLLVSGSTNPELQHLLPRLLLHSTVEVLMNME